MRFSIWIALPAALLLAACGQKAEEPPSGTEMEAVEGDAAAPQAKFGFHEAIEQPSILPGQEPDARAKAESATRDATSAAQASAGNSAPLNAAASPRIAYAYAYGFRVSALNMPGLQRSHAELCEKMSPASCRVMEMSQAGEEGDYAYGKLVLEVAAAKAPTFGAQLDTVAEGIGAEQVSSAVSGEDVSRKIVDTEAKLRARSLLRDRLMDLLASRKGTVAELIEAERGVAEVNQEIDEARSWLNELKGRVEFSRFEITYESERRPGSGFLAPISAVLGSLGMILGGVIAGLIAITVALVPIGLFVMGLRWVWRKGRELQRRVNPPGDVASLFTPPLAPPPPDDPEA